MDGSSDTSGVSGLGAQVEKLNQLVYVVVIVLIIMTATLLATVGGVVLSAYQNQAATNQDLNLQIQQLQKCLQNRADC